MTDIEQFLNDHGLGKYAARFAEDHIDLDILQDLSEADLKELGLSMGHRKVLLRAIKMEFEEPQVDSSAPQSDEIGSTAAAHPGTVLPSEAERRQLTVMFCDLAGSTALSEQYDPEDLSDIIRAYQNACGEVLKEYGGYISKFMGDGILVHFGYPYAHEDEPERAMRAGLKIVEAVESLQPRPDLKLEVRIGIATGLVVVGETIGSASSLEQLIVGETPNLAARLQGIAAPNTVVVANETRKLAGDIFHYEDLGWHSLKGFTGEINAWRVTSFRRLESRFEARLDGMTALVGRDEHIALFKDLWAQATAGQGKVALLCGEAGIGKSRVIEAFRAEVADGAHESMRFQCSTYYTKSTLYPFVEQLERRAGIDRAESAEIRLGKLEALIAAASLKSTDYVPPLATLCSIPLGKQYAAVTILPQQQKARTLQAFIDYICAVSEQRPVFAIFEDAHWADPTSLELLESLFTSIEHRRVFVIVSFRPEFEPTWQQRSNVVNIRLDRLGREESRELIGQMSGGKLLPQDLMQQLLAKTDGIPLFVEELTKTVLESPLLQEGDDQFRLTRASGDFAIPSTLQDSLMARLDRLAPIKEVAQIGAMLGREFSRDVLAAIMPIPERRLDDVLDSLIEGGLLFKRTDVPGARFAFKHALVQDAAYNSLLRSKRQSWHERVARVLEKQFPVIVESEPEQVAEHFSRAGIADRAIIYWQKAGDRAFVRSIHFEAGEHFGRALELLKAAPNTLENKERTLNILLSLGPCIAVTQAGYADAVKSTYERAKAIATDIQDLPRLFGALRGLCDYSVAKADIQTARAIGEGLLQLAERESDPVYRLDANRALGWILYQLGDFKAALTHLEAGSWLYNPQQHSPSRLLRAWDPGVVCLDFRARSLWRVGFAQQALDRAHEGLALATSLEHPPSIANALSVISNIRWLRREMRETRDATDKLLEYIAEQGLPSWQPQGISCRGWVLVMEGETVEGFKQVSEGLRVNRNGGSPIFRPYFLVRYADACLRLERYDDALDAVEEGLALERETGITHQAAELNRLRGEALLRSEIDDHVAKAQKSFETSLAIAQKQGARMLELRAASSLSRLWNAHGQQSRVHPLLAPLCAWFTEGLDTEDLREAHRLVVAAQRTESDM